MAAWNGLANILVTIKRRVTQMMRAAGFIVKAEGAEFFLYENDVGNFLFHPKKKNISDQILD